jgi:hypothetical protein
MTNAIKALLQMTSVSLQRVPSLDIVLVYGETCGSAPRAQTISVRLPLMGIHKGLGIFDPN